MYNFSIKDTTSTIDAEGNFIETNTRILAIDKEMITVLDRQILEHIYWWHHEDNKVEYNINIKDLDNKKIKKIIEDIIYERFNPYLNEELLCDNCNSSVDDGDLYLLDSLPKEEQLKRILDILNI